MLCLTCHMYDWNYSCDESIKQILDNKKEDLYFLYGLYPDKLHFNPLAFLDEPEYLTLTFKLERKK